MDSTNNPYACGDDPTNKNLQDRLHQMRLELKILRKKLSLEKSLLRRQRGELYGGDEVQENAEVCNFRDYYQVLILSKHF